MVIFMIEYIKIAVISLISGFLAPLPFSYAASYSFLSYILDFNKNSQLSVFYYSIISVVFSLVIFISLRKIYFKGFKALFSTKKSTMPNRSGYRKFMLNLLISLIPAAVMFVPYKKDKFLLDYFSEQISADHLLVTAVCCAVSGLFLLIGSWYVKQKYAQTKRSSDWKSIVRFSVYQTASYFFPGISSVSMGATSFLISDIDNRVIVREILTYIAPSILITNIFRLVRAAVTGIVLNPVVILLCVAFSAVGSAVMIHLIAKIDFRKTCVYFSVFSILFAAVSVAVLFVL